MLVYHFDIRRRSDRMHNATILIRLPAALKLAVQIAAEKEGRSASSLIRKLLKDHTSRLDREAR